MVGALPDDGANMVVCQRIKHRFTLAAEFDQAALLENAHNNVIKLPKGRLAVINGLDGYIVAEKDNVLFICKREDSSSLVKKYVNELKLKRGDEFA